MPAVSRAQQRFMGMVYATKKGEMTNPSPEVAKAAASMKKKDAKDFASTKHKGLPKKKLEEIHKQAHTPHEVPSKNLKGLVKKAVKRIDSDVDGDTDKNDKKKGELGEFIPGVGNKRLYSTTGTKTAKEATDFTQRDKIMKRAKPLHKHLYDRLHKKDMSGDVNEGSSIRQGQTSRKKVSYRGSTSDVKRDKDGNIPASHYKKEKPNIVSIKRKDTRTDDQKIKHSDAVRKHNNYKKLQAKIFAKDDARKKANQEYAAKKKINETTKYDRYDKEKKEFAKADRKMKFGKFYSKAKEAKDRLRPGEVKKWDPVKKKYVSNKD